MIFFALGKLRLDGVIRFINIRYVFTITVEILVKIFITTMSSLHLLAAITKLTSWICVLDYYVI